MNAVNHGLSFIKTRPYWQIRKEFPSNISISKTAIKPFPSLIYHRYIISRQCMQIDFISCCSLALISTHNKTFYRAMVSITPKVYLYEKAKRIDRGLWSNIFKIIWKDPISQLLAFYPLSSFSSRVEFSLIISTGCRWEQQPADSFRCSSFNNQ